MRLDENRKLAAIVLVVCILLSVFAFGGSAIGRERKKVLKVFDEGTDTSLGVRYSMDAYLDSAAECAQVMASEGVIYLGDTQLTDAVAAQAETLADDKAGLDARSEAYDALRSGIEKLYGQVKSEASDRDFRDFKLAYDDFIGQTDLAERDDYYKLAKAYNELISGFPGGIIAGITGNGALNTFGG